MANNAYLSAAPVATREAWLQAFIYAAKPYFETVGAPIPVNTRVAVGFTSKGSRGTRIGECWSHKASADEHFEIFIVPSLADPVDIAAVLTHELVHAAVGLEAKHGPIFKGVATALGLGGKMTATVPTDAWHKWADPLLDALGPIPHASLHGGSSSGPPKQKTFLKKLECDCCGWTARVTAKHIDPYSSLCCPTRCGGYLQEG